MTNNRFDENLSTVVVVFLRVFDKAEAIDVAYIALPVGSKEIKTTYDLLSREREREREKGGGGEIREESNRLFSSTHSILPT